MDKPELSGRFIYVEHQVSQGCQVNEALTFCFKSGHVLLSQMVNTIFLIIWKIRIIEDGWWLFSPFWGYLLLIVEYKNIYLAKYVSDLEKNIVRAEIILFTTVATVLCIGRCLLSMEVELVYW